MRTWDTSPLASFEPEAPLDEVLLTNPTAAPLIANYAIRGQDPREGTPGLGVRLATAGMRLFDREFQNGESSVPTLAQSWQACQRPFNFTPNILYNFSLQINEKDVFRALSRRVIIFNQLTKDTQPDISIGLGLNTEINRDYFREKVAETMRHPDGRKRLMDAVDTYADASNQKVRRRLKKGPVTYDYVIQGGGVHTANLVSTLQEADPEGKILVIDDGSNVGRLGGQFRSYGARPTFTMNSQQKTIAGVKDIYGLPTHTGELNSMGLHATINLADFVATSAPTNLDPGDAAALNIVLAGADILFAGRNEIELDQLPFEIKRPYETSSVISIPNTARKKFDRFYIFSRTKLVRSLGAGTITKDAAYDDGDQRIFSSAQLHSMYGNYRPGTQHPAEVFGGKDVAIGGCGDTGKIDIKLLLGQGPAEAYQGLRMERLRPRRILWISRELGKLGTKASFQPGVRPIYASIAGAMPVGRGASALIEPVAGRVQDVTRSYRKYASFGSNGVNVDVARSLPADWMEIFVRPAVVTKQADHYISATGVDNPTRDVDMEFGNTLTDSLGTPIGREALALNSFLGQNAYVIGQAAQLGINSTAGVPENTASIWSLAPSITLFGYNISRKAKNSRKMFGR